jgi:pimeloyl-ACP methyl ester carboxylesterase
MLLHDGGYGGDALNTYGRMIDPLASDYRLVLPEMLGFGGTDKAVFFGENPYAPRLRHLAAFMDALSLDDVHLVGNSFGGGVSLHMSLSKQVSWRLRSVTSISGTGGPFRRDEALKDMARYHPDIENARRIDGWILPPDVTDEEHSQQRLISSQRAGQWESMMAMSLRSPIEQATPSSGAPKFPEVLANSTVPTLLIVGTQDRMLEPGWEDHLSPHLPDVRVERLESGHSPNISHPLETARVLRSFIEQVRA